MYNFDIGTAQCKVAFVNANGEPEMILNSRGEARTPSAVYFQPDGSVLIGVDAIEQSYIDPNGLAANFKLRLGTTENVLGNGQLVTATDATASLIGQLKLDVERQLGMQITECMATCPANFHDDGKQALLEAFDRNGLKVLKLVPEPTAAGFAYAFARGSDKRIIAVFDFGGGTFDASVLEAHHDQINVLSTQGVAKLGGNDFNDLLRGFILKGAEKQIGPIPSSSVISSSLSSTSVVRRSTGDMI